MQHINGAPRLPSITTVLVSASVLALTGCGGSSSGDSTNTETDGVGDNVIQVGDTVVQPATETAPAQPVLPSGVIIRYGAINVADEAGVADDVVGSFFMLGDGVSTEAVENLFANEAADCQTFESPAPSVFDISAVFLPRLADDITPISVGPTLSLDSPTGTYAGLEESDVGQFLFYSLPNDQQLPDGAVPEGLVASIDPNEFELSGVFGFGDVEPLDDFDWGQNEEQGSFGVSANTLFSWTPAEQPGQLVRIETQTVDGFFTEESITVKCVVPDSGSFAFPGAVQDSLGEDFEGAEPLFSRLGIQTRIEGTTAVFTVRESF